MRRNEGEGMGLVNDSNAFYGPKVSYLLVD